MSGLPSRSSQASQGSRKRAQADHDLRGRQSAPVGVLLSGWHGWALGVLAMSHSCPINFLASFSNCPVFPSGGLARGPPWLLRTRYPPRRSAPACPGWRSRSCRRPPPRINAGVAGRCVAPGRRSALLSAHELIRKLKAHWTFASILDSSTWRSGKPLASAISFRRWRFPASRHLWGVVGKPGRESRSAAPAGPCVVVTSPQWRIPRPSSPYARGAGAALGGAEGFRRVEKAGSCDVAPVYRGEAAHAGAARGAQGPGAPCSAAAVAPTLGPRRAPAA